MKSIFKMTGRTIRSFKGRYMAILLIVALSAGFFAGLKITTDAMLHTGGEYFEEQNFYDFRLFSTLGFTEDDVKEFGKLNGVETAEGTYSLDALMVHKDSDHPFKLYAISENINVPSLSAGRMPTADNECLADEDVFTEEDIGKTISLADENDTSVTDSLERNEYTIVGLVSSPLHIGLDRGTPISETAQFTAFSICLRLISKARHIPKLTYCSRIPLKSTAMNMTSLLIHTKQR